MIIPAHDEPGIAAVIDGVLGYSLLPCEVLVVVDTADDPTLAALGPHAACGLVSGFPPGPAWAIRYGLLAARAPVRVVMMADGSDDPAQLPELVRLVEGGAAVAAASRYAPGGAHDGGPAVKHFLSRVAGRSLAFTGTCDATNAYKAYAAGFLNACPPQSRHGFEMGLEMVARAARSGRFVAEVPTAWRDRAEGESRFRLARWLPHYLRWYALALAAR